jgi:outer membrane protein TolC
MRWFKVIVAALALGGMAGMASAQKITVDRAVELAIANNLSLASERVGVESRKLVRDTAWNAFIPSMSAGASLSRLNDKPEGIVVPGFFEIPAGPQWNLAFTLSASLRLNVALRDGIRQTVLDYEGGLLSLETAQKRLSRDVRKSFYDLLLQNEGIALTEQSIAAADKRYAQARANYQAGLVPEYAVLSAQVALENLKPGLVAQRNAYDASVGAFRMSLGLERTAPVALDGTIGFAPVPVDGPRLIDARLPMRLDIRNLDLAILSLRNARAAAVNQSMTPSVSLSFLVDPTFGREPFKDDLFSSDNWSQSRGAVTLAITMPLDPFLPDSSTRVSMTKLDNQIRQTELQRSLALRAAELEVETLVRNLDRTRTSIATLELNVGLAERAYRLAEEAYNAGGRELLEVQNAELELNKARLEVLRAKYSYITGLLDLEYAVDMSLREEGKK